MAPRIPTTRATEMLCYTVAGVTAFAPVYFMLPGAERRLATQTAKWAPHWERNITYFVPAAEKSIQRIEPPVSKAVRTIERQLPLEKIAKNVDGSIRKSIEAFKRQ